MKISTFTYGAVAGITTLALAAPFLVQLSSAAADGTTPFARPAPTQAQVQEMVTRDDAFLKNMAALATVQKSATQAHRDALAAAASITDDAQRHTAVQKANEDMRAAMQAALAANHDLKSAMMPFGGGRGQGEGKGKGGFGGMMGRGPDTATLAAKLGMTQTELEAALEGGKTIAEIATEKGVSLPACNGEGAKHSRGGMMGRGPAAGTTSSAESAE